MPDPTVMYTAPPPPLTAVPVPIVIEPELPDDADPVLNTMLPLTPAVPALGVDSVIAPDDVDALEPVVRVTAPPVRIVAIPADIVNAPPLPETLDPTNI